MAALPVSNGKGLGCQSPKATTVPTVSTTVRGFGMA